MGRLQILTTEEMSDEQKRLQERIAGGKRGGFRGPFNVWVYSPGFLDLFEKVGGYLRYETVFPPRLSEMAILITARFWTAQYEWFAHEPHARNGGLDSGIIDAIRENRRPEKMQPDEAALYDYCTELHSRHSVSNDTYQAAVEQFGTSGVVDLTGLIGHYTTVSMTLNAFEVPIPEGQMPPLSSLGFL